MIITSTEWFGRHFKTQTAANGRILASTFHIPGTGNTKKLTIISYYGVSAPQNASKKDKAENVYTQLAQIVKASRKSHNITVVAGDTNCIGSQRDRDQDDDSKDATTPRYRKLQDMGMLDSWRQANGPDAKGFTRVRIHKTTETGQILSKGRLDQIWLDRSNDYRTVSSHILDSEFDTTDHTHYFTDIRMDGKLHLEESRPQRTGPITSKYTKENTDQYSAAVSLAWGTGEEYEALHDYCKAALQQYQDMRGAALASLENNPQRMQQVEATLEEPLRH